MDLKQFQEVSFVVLADNLSGKSYFEGNQGLSLCNNSFGDNNVWVQGFGNQQMMNMTQACANQLCNMLPYSINTIMPEMYIFLCYCRFLLPWCHNKPWLSSKSNPTSIACNYVGCGNEQCTQLSKSHWIIPTLQTDNITAHFPL